MERTLCKAVWFAERFDAEAARALRAAHKRSFDVPIGFRPVLLQDSVLTLREVVDVLLFMTRNASDCGPRLYKQIYWACMLLLSHSEEDGRLLIQALIETGFMFDSDAERAVSALRRDPQETPISQLLWHVQQLQAALPDDPGAVVASVYNHLAKHCRIRTPYVHRTTAADLKAMVRKFAGNDENAKERVLDYIQTHCTGTRRRVAARVSTGDTDSIVVRLEPRRQPELVHTAAVFASVRRFFDLLVHDVAGRLCVGKDDLASTDFYWRCYADTQATESSDRVCE
jgi:hypothetical protein